MSNTKYGNIPSVEKRTNYKQNDMSKTLCTYCESNE